MDINGNTRVVGIFGDPVGQTISPAVQNAAFKAAGLNLVYVPFHVKSSAGGLRAAVRAVRAMGLLGVNITIPHKEAIIRHLDEVEQDAMHIGAVNTVVNRGGRLVGYNTDGAGYLLSLRHDTGFTPRGRNVVLIGAGGAARSILYSILRAGPASVALANRTTARAGALARRFASVGRARIEAVSLDREALAPHLRKADLVVNTTCIGMMGQGSLDIALDELPRTAIVSDIVYRPLRTALLKAAAKRGLRTHAGAGMLVRQGAIAFELWTGKKAPLAVMEKAALKALRAK